MSHLALHVGLPDPASHTLPRSPTSHVRVLPTSSRDVRNVRARTTRLCLACPTSTRAKRPARITAFTPSLDGPFTRGAQAGERLCH